MRIIIALFALLSLCGCGGGAPSANAVDAVTPAEAEALNDAAQMLDQTEPPPKLTEDTEQDQATPTPVK